MISVCHFGRPKWLFNLGPNCQNGSISLIIIRLIIISLIIISLIIISLIIIRLIEPYDNVRIDFAYNAGQFLTVM